jgi:hypothetical protein
VRAGWRKRGENRQRGKKYLARLSLKGLVEQVTWSSGGFSYRCAAPSAVEVIRVREID